MRKSAVLPTVLVWVAAGCVTISPDTASGVSVTQMTQITVELEEGTLTVTRPVGCNAESGAPIDLNSEPADRLAFVDYLRWFDADGCPVRVDVISHVLGAEHCGWRQAQFIIIGKPLGAPVESLSLDRPNRYVWNAGGVIDSIPPGESGTRSDLPVSAFPTGYSQGTKQLWLDGANESVLYVLQGDTVQVWTRDFEAGRCR